ncbi:hypothetical protein L6164_012752 [Bauhinia variegata]|uniref:Uncharacterized protein n=1 Tax=Bauhinia variegata TaxID=167791 RepID=A0ACB9PAZ0_BAUVA|nr:hypothetical protein L6164_012752 [Bauhinia variegata]
MALNLELASQTLNPETHSLTIFALSEASFNQMRQLPLSLPQYHLLPHAFSLQSLSSLPFGAKIATMLPGSGALRCKRNCIRNAIGSPLHAVVSSMSLL